MPLSDVIKGDPGPKKGKGSLSWDQMKLWNKYYDNNSGKSVDEIFSIMAKENPSAVKGLTPEKLKGVFREQSISMYDKDLADYDSKKASGYFDSDRWKQEKGAGWDPNWTPQYRSVNKFLPAKHVDEKGKETDLGLTNEYGEFENPSSVKISRGGPVKAFIAKEIPSDIPVDEVEMDDQYEGYASYIDPREGSTKYVSVQEAEKRFGKDWHNKVQMRNDERIEEAKKRRAALLAKLGMNEG